jgi:fructose-bisphosphate aldolase class II
MKLLSACGEPVLGTELMLSDLKAFMGETSPYRNLRVLPHLDHAFPWLDGDILENYVGRFASVMCDASEKPFAENVCLTAAYVEKVRGRVVVEGAVDEIFEAGGEGQKNELTTAEQARKFLDQTGVDLIVPNVGTEHRATAAEVCYHGERAREISARVGKVLCLHGTSSVKAADLPGLPEDGFIKINIYTTLAVHGGQALAREVLRGLGNIFTEPELRELVREGVLGERVLEAGYGDNQLPLKPRLNWTANPRRRDAWSAAVRRKCREFMELFRYARFAVQ